MKTGYAARTDCTYFGDRLRCMAGCVVTRIEACHMHMVLQHCCPCLLKPVLLENVCKERFAGGPHHLKKLEPTPLFADTLLSDLA